MGLMVRFFDLIFGNGRSDLTDLAEVFRENAEGAAVRAADAHTAALDQFAAEFQHERKGLFDRFIDGLNRLPRPAMALGTLALFASAMFNPEWFITRMDGLQQVPEPLWWLLGAVVSFYFGARHQWKAQEFQKSMAQRKSTSGQQPPAISPQDTVQAPSRFDDNAALQDWVRWRRNRTEPQT